MISRSTLLARSTLWQGSEVLSLWILLGLYIFRVPGAHVDPKISLATFIAIPAGVIGVAQLLITAHIQRAAYIKDYALRFRTDKELSESFHYLIYLYGNKLYDINMKPADQRTAEESRILAATQNGISADLCFFNPNVAVGAPQERRLDNVLGFFDTVGYDYSRRMLQMRDIAGVFGFHLDHLIQRKVVQEYLEFVRVQWPTAKSFHEQYIAPVPFRYLRALLRAYIEYRKEENRHLADREDQT